MKYTIEGFSQKEAVRLKLDVKDLIMLRWMVDFYNTGKMEMHITDGKTYFWIDYRYLMRQLPILEITSQKVLSRRMKRLTDRGILESIKRPDTYGVRMYFRLSEEALLSLLTEKERQIEFKGGRHSKVLPSPRVARVELKSSRGRHSKVPGVGTQKSHGVDSSINDSSINDNKQPSAALSKRFDEVFKKNGFNIYAMVNKFRKESKLRDPIPDEVMLAVCDSFDKYKPKDAWPYFMRVLAEESKRYFARKNIEESNQYKKPDSAMSLSNILNTCMAGAH